MLYQLGCDDDKDILIQQLRQQLQQLQLEKDHIQYEKDQEMDRLQDTVQQEKEQIQKEKDTLQRQRDSVLRENGRLQQEKNRIAQNNQQLQREKEQIQQERDQLQRDREQSHWPWVVTREEIRLTPVVLGAGSYGEVKIAEFRGIKVAAKCLHNIILSPYNLGLFSREMEIASRLRHPNLVQFVGATREGAPIIISELMSTSLHKELQQSGSGLDQPTVINISRDVACALNYLHLWRPHPILHRDISSPNVLLEGVVGRGWKAKLSDFGSTNIQSQTSTKVPGNPYYASPEANQPWDHSPAMDVYSYGVLVMEMCVHQPPGLTVPDKQRQIDSISWSTMKDLVVRCVNDDRHQRPSISQVLAQLSNL